MRNEKLKVKMNDLVKACRLGSVAVVLPLSFGLAQAQMVVSQQDAAVQPDRQSVNWIRYVDAVETAPQSGTATETRGPAKRPMVSNSGVAKSSPQPVSAGQNLTYIATGSSADLQGQVVPSASEKAPSRGSKPSPAANKVALPAPAPMVYVSTGGDMPPAKAMAETLGKNAQAAAGSEAALDRTPPQGTVPQARNEADRQVVENQAKAEVASQSAQATKRSVSSVQPSMGASQNLQSYLALLVSKALATSPDIRMSNAKWQATEYDIEQAKGQRWPQIQVGGATRSATFGSGNSNTTTSEVGVGNISMVTPLYDWGHIGRTIDSRSETAKAAQQEMEQARQKVAFDTASAILDSMRGRVSLERTEIYVKRMGELVSMLSEIVKSDQGRRSELTQARARELQAITSRDLIAARLRETEVNLLKLVGEPVQLPAGLEWNSPAVKLDDALAALPDHPILKQALAEAKSSSFYAESVKASRLPQLNWVVSKTTQPDALGKTQPWATNVAFQWNAFQGGSADAAQHAAQERAVAGEQKAQSVLRDLEYRLRTSAEQRDSARKRAVEYSDLIAESDRVRKAFYEQWYHLGKRTLLDVLIAENDHYNNEIAQVNSRFDADAADLRIRGDSGLILSWLLPQAQQL